MNFHNISIFSVRTYKNSCKLREVNNQIKQRVEQTVKQLYKRIEGKIDESSTLFMGERILYPTFTFLIKDQQQNY